MSDSDPQHDAASEQQTPAADQSAPQEKPLAPLHQRTFDDLPPYSRSLLQIKVPVAATLASTHRPVAEIVKLGPGAIIQFEKSCEELLEVYADGQLIARGEAVKVGEKFGLRIKSMVLPDERFHSARK